MGNFNELDWHFGEWKTQSTRCPNKLIRPFGGTTLFELALQKLSVLSAKLPVYVGVAEQELLDLASDTRM